MNDLPLAYQFHTYGTYFQMTPKLIYDPGESFSGTVDACITHDKNFHPSLPSFAEVQ